MRPFAGLGVTLFAVSALSGVLEPPSRVCAEPEAAPPLAERPVSPFGVSSSGEAAGHYGIFLPKMAQVGVQSVRLFGEWGGLEPRENGLDLSHEDRRVDTHVKLGLEPNGSFLYTPLWALPKGADLKTFPIARLDAFGRYVGRVVEHFRGRIRYWEVWNEPNSPAFNRGGHTAADYARMVATAHAAAKKADPKALIGVTCANVDVRFLKLVFDALRAQKAPEAFDFVAVHPYDLLARIGSEDGELVFLSIVDNLRKLLADVVPARAKVPIRFTEVGAPTERFSERDAAALLLKGFTLALAEGVEQVQWFEARDAGASKGFGLLREDLTERLTYQAYGALTDLLGERPSYRGWVVLAEVGYGFVFANGKQHAMVAWMPKGQSAAITLGGAAKVVDPLTRKRRSLVATDRLTLTDLPALVDNVPAALVQKASDNRAKAYAWGKAAIDAQHAAITFGPRNKEQGLTQPERGATEPVTFEDGSTGVRVNVGRGNALRISTRPSFADYGTRDVYVRVTARTMGPMPTGRSAGMNLWYQPISGSPDRPPPYPYANSGHWWTVPDDQRWHDHTWHLTDAMFVQTFGFGLYLQFDASVPFAVGKVEISKVPFAARR